MLQKYEEIPEWIINTELNPETPSWIETQDDWSEYVDTRTMEGLMEEEKPRPEVCPICRSHLDADCNCDFCGFGDKELFDALQSAGNIHEAYAEF